jgi:hypothetical protein
VAYLPELCESASTAVVRRGCCWRRVLALQLGQRTVCPTDSQRYLVQHISNTWYTVIYYIGLWDVEDLTFSRQSAHRWRWGQPYAPAALYCQKDLFYYVSVTDWVNARAIARQERLGKLKNSNGLTGNRTHDHTACSIVPQPTTIARRKLFCPEKQQVISPHISYCW